MTSTNVNCRSKMALGSRGIITLMVFAGLLACVAGFVHWPYRKAWPRY
jgi:hypothetical protein